VDLLKIVAQGTQYILRTLIERTIEVKINLYLCFIDYTKAFDKVKHKELIDVLNSINIDGKDIRLIRNLYRDQSAAVRIENELCPYQNVKLGVRQGCVMSPELFSLYSEIIMRNLEDLPGISVGGININNLRFADDTILIATNEEDLQTLVDTIVRESSKMGLSLNKKKTEVMVTSNKETDIKSRIKVERNFSKAGHKF
jgi:hypothetical protein